MRLAFRDCSNPNITAEILKLIEVCKACGLECAVEVVEYLTFHNLS